MPTEPRADFLHRLRLALDDGSFVRLVLGKPRSNQDLLRLEAAIVTTSRGSRLQLHFRHRRRDLTQPVDAAGVLAAVETHLGQPLRSGHLFTTTGVWQIEYNKKDEPRLSRGPAPHQVPAPAPHDRPKHRPIALADAPWLRALGLAGADGAIRTAMTAKYRQINRYVELLLPLCEEAGLARRESLRVFDMGAGKGYLTFAAWHALTRTLGCRVTMTGVEVRPELVALCNQAAREAACDGLEFVASRIVDFPAASADVLIALHACDTATDEALFRGLRAGAALIVVAPCCHQEIRPQLTVPADWQAVGRHGIFADRFAEMITDALRALLLEAHGYRVQICEFVATEHTPKNTMLAAVRRAQPDAAAAAQARAEFASLMSRCGLVHQYLDTLLRSHAPVPAAGAPGKPESGSHTPSP